MQENNLFVEKTIEVGENKKYYIIKQLMYNNTIYLLANKLINDETPSETISIIKVNNNNADISISLEKNEKTIRELLRKFAEIL